MDTHSRSASPREASRPQHRPPSPPGTHSPSAPASPTAPASPAPAGFDNRGYQHDDPNHNDSFTSHQQNGHKDHQPNGTDQKTLEAVNLELINLTPKNGAKKKDVEVDMNATNPYDEYFVPVNEHRKYMRGEKLYVTADKRGEKGGCRRPLCWTLLALVVAAIVALIVLAATGILFANTPTSLDQYNTSLSSARALGGLGHDHGAHDHYNIDHDHSAHEHSAHDHDFSANDDSAHDHSNHAVPGQTSAEKDAEAKDVNVPMADDSNDMSIYVPRTVEGELKIDNEEFSSVLQDPESEEFRQFNENFGSALKRALFDRNMLEAGDHKIGVQVVQIRPGSLVVSYRIHWTPKSSSEGNEDLLTARSLKSKLDSYLDKNSRMISVYHVSDDRMSTRQVLDLCQINKNDCEHGCTFDENSLEFICTCPRGQILDMVNQKKCMSIFESSEQMETKTGEDNKQKEFRVLDIDSTGTTTRPIPEEQKPDNNFDWKNIHDIIPEVTTEGDHAQSSEEVNRPAIVEPHPTAEPTSEPEPTPEPKPEPEPAAEPKPEPEPEPTPTPEPKPEPEPTAEPQPTTTEAQTESRHMSETLASSELSEELHSFVDLRPTHEPQATAEPQPTSEPQPNPEPQPAAEPLPTAEPQPTAEPEPTPEPTAEPQPAAEPQPTTEPQPAAEPLPSTEPQPTAEPKSSIEQQLFAEPEPNAEPQPPTESKTEQEAEPRSNPEPAAKPSTTTSEYSFEPINTTPEPQLTSEPSADREPKLGLINTDISQETELRTTTEPKMDSEENSQEDNTNLQIANTKYENKFDDSKLDDETTTMKTPVTESVLGQEMKSVFSIYEHKKNESGLNDDMNHDREKIAHKEATNMEDLKNEAQTESSVKNASDTVTSTTENYMHFYNVNLKNDDLPEKYFRRVEDVVDETTTNHNTNMNMSKMSESEDDISFDQISKDHKSSVSIMRDSTTKVNVEQPTTTSPFTVLTTSEEAKMNPTEIRESNSNDYIIPFPNIQRSNAIETPYHNDSESAMRNESQNDAPDKPLNSILLEASSLATNKPITEETTTLKPQTTTEFFISKQNNSDAEQSLVFAVLDQKNTTHTTTEKEPSYEGVDITFDTINMLYNRSSKSFENHTEIGNETTEITEPKVSPTTESDWLVEPVTEVNYNVMMSRPEKQETTETNSHKLQEIINRGISKDDIEPDYLNINPTKTPDQDEPLYGMIHDYDNEDSRVKRVNTEIKDAAVKKNMTANTNQTLHTNESEKSVTIITAAESHNESSINENSQDDTNKKTTANIDNSELTQNQTTISEEKSSEESQTATETPKVDLPTVLPNVSDNMSNKLKTENESTTVNINSNENLETTTTVTQYVYKGFEKSLANPLTRNESSRSWNNEPAPVWETDNTDVKQLEIHEQGTSGNNTTNTSVIHADKTFTNKSTTTLLESDLGVIAYNHSESIESQNTTQVNNLNVTIYEIPGSNQSVTTSKSTTHSAEYEDHETEMNPFLPEVENNKSLVKKLQEGHDLEPANMNETQNENTDEHNSHSLGAPTEPSNSDAPTTTKAQDGKESSTNEDEASINDLINESYSYPEDENSGRETTERGQTNAVTDRQKSKSEDKTQIATFLLDTDDLDVSKDHSMEGKSDNSASVPMNAVSNIANDDSDFLSVVPIADEKLEERETLKKNFKSGGIQELNDISDSPKKSDRRTLGASKLDSVINNEA